MSLLAFLQSHDHIVEDNVMRPGQESLYERSIAVLCFEEEWVQGGGSGIGKEELKKRVSRNAVSPNILG